MTPRRITTALAILTRGFSVWLLYYRRWRYHQLDYQGAVDTSISFATGGVRGLLAWLKDIGVTADAHTA